MIELDFRLVLDTLADAVVAANGTGSIVYGNRAAEELLRYPPGELTGKPLITLVPARLHADHRRGFNRFLSTRRPELIGRAVRVPALRRDGSEVEIELTLSAFRVGGQDLFVGSLRDMSERVELERQLTVTRYLRAANRAAAELTSRLDLEFVLQTVVDTLVEDFDAALARVWLYEAATNILHLRASAGLSRATSESSRARIDVASYPYKVGEVARTRKPFVKNGLDGDPQFEQEWVAREKLAAAAVFPLLIGGELRGVLVYFSRQELREEVVEVLTTFAANVSTSINDTHLLLREQEARAEAERERDLVQRAEEWLSTTLRSIGDAVIATDASGRVAFMNPVAEALTGWKQEEAAGNDLSVIFRICNEETRQDIENPVRRVLREGKIVGLANHTLLISRDGQGSPIDDSGAPIRDGQGKLIGVVLTFHDISDRRQAEEALRQRAEALAESDRRKDHYLTMLAHELRNPLAPIMNAAQLLKLLPSHDPRIERVQQIVERQVLHMARLIDDLLEVTRITHGKIVLRRERLDLARLVRDTTEDRRSVIEQAGLTLAVEAPEEPVPIFADPTRIAQVLENLLQNAAKFSDPGGRVSVRVEVDPAEQRAAVMVEDTGIGIAPEVLPQLFESFAQADRSLDRSRGGLGLDLALVKGLIQLHGGEVRACSEGQGRGATFTFLLPLESGAGRAQTATPEHGAARPQRILVVEDNRDAAETLRELLELSGHEVAVAYSGPAGVEAARQFRPEVVLCDLGLPGMDGYRVVAELRRDPAVAAARMIAISGYGEEEDRRRSREAGFDLHLTKPVGPTALEQLWAELTPEE